MTHSYNITGMTCTGCQAKVQSLLTNIAHVTNVAIDLANNKADITMDEYVSTAKLQAALSDYPKYSLSAVHHRQVHTFAGEAEDHRSFLETYKPVLLIFGYVTFVALLIAPASGGFDWMLAMRAFMGGFFLVFSFFKILDIPAFADTYSTYDIIAKKFRTWGLIYVFIELSLGIAYITNLNPLVTNIVTLVVMSVSIIGVLKSAFNKRKIKCACLGAVFNLPMSTVTIIEDALMIAMSAVMLIAML